MITTIIMRVELEKPVPDLLDKVAGRVYTLDGVKDVYAKATVLDVELLTKVIAQLGELAYGK